MLWNCQSRSGAIKGPQQRPSDCTSYTKDLTFDLSTERGIVVYWAHSKDWSSFFVDCNVNGSGVHGLRNINQGRRGSEGI